MWLFRSVFVVLFYIIINTYTGIKTYKLVKFFIPSFKALIFWPLYILLCYSFLIVTLTSLSRILPLRQAAMNMLPVFFYFFLILLFFDVIRLILRYRIIIPRSPKFTAACTGISLILAILLFVFGNFHARNIKTIPYDVIITKNAGVPLRIALITDLHLGMSVDRSWTANIVDAVNKARPDLICIAGDIFDSDISTIKDLFGIAKELERLSAPLGVYACQGNHDVDRRSRQENSGTDRIKEFLESTGIRFLLDEEELVEDRFYLVGRRDGRPIGSSRRRLSAGELLEDLDKTKPLIIMDHQPADYPALEEAGADLILSGHTHGGQIFPGSLITAGMYRNYGAQNYGHFKGRTVQGIISSGAGVWGPAIRMGTNSEVAVINIEFVN